MIILKKGPSTDFNDVATDIIEATDEMAEDITQYVKELVVLSRAPDISEDEIRFLSHLVSLYVYSPEDIRTVSLKNLRESSEKTGRYILDVLDGKDPDKLKN